MAMTFDDPLRALARETYEALQWPKNRGNPVAVIEAFGREVAARQKEADACVAEATHGTGRAIAVAIRGQG